MVIFEKDSGGPRSSRPAWVSDIQPTPSGSQRELLELRKSFSNLSKQYKTATVKIDGLREERMALRQKLTTKDKQLSLMKRRVSALSGERDVLQRERATEHAHLQKLEAKVNAMEDHGHLYDKFQAMKRKLKTSREENEALKVKLQSCAEDQQNQSHEINTLQTALRLKTQEIVEETGKDIPTRLLYAVARSREDGVMLAIQLTDEKEKSRKLEAELDLTRSQLSKSEEGRKSTLEILEKKERSILSLQAASKSLQNNFEKVQTQFDASRAECETKHGEVRDLKETIDACHNLEKELRKQMHSDEMRAIQREKDVRAELLGALEREAANGQEEQKKAQEAQHALEMQVKALQSDLRESDYNHQQSRLAVDRYTISLHEAEERIQNILLHSDSKESALKEDLKALDAHCTALTEKCSSLSDEVSSAKSEIQFHSQKAEEAARRAQRADSLLSQEEQKWQGERAKMIHKLEDTLVQLSGAIEKSDRLERDVVALKAESDIKENRIQQISQEIDQIRESNNALYKSKELLQRAMLEQVSDVRQRLDQAGLQNKELEATLYKQRETERVLKDMIRSTHASPAPLPQTRTAPAAHFGHNPQQNLAFPSPIPGTGVTPPGGRNASDPQAGGAGGAGAGGLDFPSLEQLAGIDKDVISKLLTPQSAMRLRSL